MVAFLSVLEELERCSEEAGRAFVPPCGGMMEPFLLLDANAASPARAIAAYQSFQTQEAPQAERDRFARLLSEAKDSAEALQTLRRRLAWILHPDRRTGGDSVATLSLSEINAAIDAALARCAARERRE